MFEIKTMPYDLRNESIVILSKYNFIKYDTAYYMMEQLYGKL